MPRRAEPGRAGPGRAEPSRAESRQATGALREGGIAAEQLALFGVAWLDLALTPLSWVDLARRSERTGVGSTFSLLWRCAVSATVMPGPALVASVRLDQTQSFALSKSARPVTGARLITSAATLPCTLNPPVHASRSD